jgi:hypothetical protein
MYRACRRLGPASPATPRGIAAGHLAGDSEQTKFIDAREKPMLLLTITTLTTGILGVIVGWVATHGSIGRTTPRSTDRISGS